jgi:hypothetical protein
MSVHLPSAFIMSVFLIHHRIGLRYFNIKLAGISVRLKVHFVLLAFVEREVLILLSFLRFQRGLIETLYWALGELTVEVRDIRETFD